MARKPGDITRKRAPSFLDLANDFADKIGKQDSRFNRFWSYVPVPKVMEWFKSPKKTKVLLGGNRSTKTTAGIFEAVMIYTGMIPPSLQGVYPHKLPTNRPRRVRIILQSFSKHWPETIKPLLLGDPDTGAEGMLSEAWSEWNELEHIFYGPDGSMLSIMALDPTDDIDPRVLRGAQMDHTMIDELTSEAAYTESLTRGAALKDGPRTVTLTFCPQEGYENWTYERLYLTNFDARTKRRLPPDKVNPDIHVDVVTMRDNPSISEEQRQAIIGSLRPWEVAFRVDGEYSQMAANPFFDVDRLIEWEEQKRVSEGEPVRVIELKTDVEAGTFVGALDVLKSFDERDGPVWRMWDIPRDKHRYVLAMDCAEGNVDSDYQAASVWDGTDEKKILQVAQLRVRELKAGDFALQCACMANVFGNCLIIPEAKGVGGGIVIDRIRNYPNLYHRVTVGREDEEETKRLGWDTNVYSKGPMLEDLYRTLLDMHGKGHCPIRSRQTLMELMSYEERIDRNKTTNVVRVIWSARKGAHDDTVMEMAMGFRVILHEYDKLSCCVVAKKERQSPPLTKLEEQAAKQKAGGRAFESMKPKSRLADQRRKIQGRKDPHARQQYQEWRFQR